MKIMEEGAWRKKEKRGSVAERAVEREEMAVVVVEASSTVSVDALIFWKSKD
jgi:hypothetical protein